MQVVLTKNNNPSKKPALRAPDAGAALLTKGQAVSQKLYNSGF
jgi:hypothetical protein